MTATLTISARERDTLHGLTLRRLLILAERTSELAKAEGITVEEVCERFGDDLRLMEEIGRGPGAARSGHGIEATPS